ncbi:MAG: arginine--tRNA ligase [Litorilinea sp.]
MIKNQVQAHFQIALQAAQTAGELPDVGAVGVDILRPKQAEHGDYSTNFAMVLAAAVRKAGGANANPRQIAQTLIDHLPNPEDNQPGLTYLIGGVEIAGPGFINIRLSDEWLQTQVTAIIRQGEQFGSIDRGQGAKWQVEYVSANPTGPIHYGGARNAVLGDSLANVLTAAGYAVQREYYVNDAGTQFTAFAETLYARYLQHFGQEEPLPENGYQGEYMVEYARKIAEAHGDQFLHVARETAVDALKPIGRELVLGELQTELLRLGVQFDNWFSEQSLYKDGVVDLVLEDLDQRGLLTRHDGAVWFRATEFPKNDKDEVVIRSSGAHTYFAGDLAYHYDKFERRKFDHVVNVWAVDHQGHVPRMAAIMQALELDPDRLTILMYDLVRLVRDGEEVKLSKRAGNLITINDVVEEVGADAVRFNLLTRSPESTIEFDLDLAVTQSNDNPVYYVQYSHARICSILARAAQEDFVDLDQLLASDQAMLSQLAHPSELTLIRVMLSLEEQIDMAVDKLSPHNLPHFAMDLARTFNAFYRDCKVVDAGNLELSRARLLLCRAAKVALERVLALIGVSAPETM